ncbi:MAG TPA: M13 family metallopeptidase [Steroidobacteraceae bacterium]
MTRTLLTLAVLLAVAPAQTAPKLGDFGIDLSARDSHVKPGDDFYRYANGHWLDTASIPADRATWGSFAVLDERATANLREIVERLPATAAAGTNQQKVRDFYRSFVDTAAIERAGLEPARAALHAIAAASSYEDLSRLMGRPDLDLTAPIRMGIITDPKNPDRYIVALTQSGLGLPDRDYYLKDEAVYKTLREKYQAHIERMLTLAGDRDAAAGAKSILEIETRIATLHWPVAKRRERDLTYNLRSRAQLEQLAPAIAWRPYLRAAGLDSQQQFVVRELDAIESLAKLFREIPVERWRPYFAYHYLVAVADVLPKAFDDEKFDFYGRALSGQREMQERWKRAIAALNSNLGEALGQLYVEKYFPPASKRQVQDLVEILRTAYGDRIRHLRWMSNDTKQVALEKLAAFRPKIGYPDRWRDYSKLTIRAGDAFGNLTRAGDFEWWREQARLGKPTDRGEWTMTPQTVNAYYNPTFNEVVFPAAILQPPFFDPGADAAVNYGAIGVVIGHEMGHGFDDQGSKSDARGVLRTWWQPQDDAAFRKLVDRLADQYSGYEVLPGLRINGRLTLGENIGDVGGMSVAYDAYHRSLRGATPPVIDGLTGEQRFFLSEAQIWQNLDREERLRIQVMSNPHSPSKFRVNGVVRNVDAWYTAFDVKPGDKLYLPPEERVHIW